ncbi:hypothetical protein [Nesterenkonia ebinurensis]|uniref:hypothetical protein n=1 Tax=Nesterenkonia ebinurensis TaxID=2608252 RepID=UPI00123CDB7A|nr:hypothetical protein [Nesterenkonia ebinurensis]
MTVKETMSIEDELEHHGRVAGGVHPGYKAHSRARMKLREQLRHTLRMYRAEGWEMPLPYNSELTVEKFVLGADAEAEAVFVEIRGKSEDSPERYVLYLEEGMEKVSCEGPEGPVEFVHPLNMKVWGYAATLPLWFDWLARRDAQNAHSWVCTEEHWESEDIETQLYRVERAIVSFDSTSNNTANFRTAQEFTDWLNEAAGPSTAQLKVLALTDAQAFSAGAEGSLYCTGLSHQAPGASGELPGELVVRPLEITLGDLTQKPRGVRSLGEGVGDWAGFSLVMDGAAVEQFHGDDMVPLYRVQEAFGTGEPRHPWWGITEEGVDSVLLVPARKAVVTLRYDRDGADVWFSAQSEDKHLNKAWAEEMWARRWGRELDHTRQLSQQEVQASVQKAEQQLIELHHQQQEERKNDDEASTGGQQ